MVSSPIWDIRAVRTTAIVCCLTLFADGTLLPAILTNYRKPDVRLKAFINPEEYLESEPFDELNILENDILKPKKDRFTREVNSARQWPSRFVPFEIDPKAGFEKNETDMLSLAFKEFADRTCVQFVPRTNERDYVFITTDAKRGCLSYIGWQGGRQEVFLLRPNCFYLKGTIIHELMHTDDHVQVLWDNIRPDKTSNFQIEPAGNMLNAPYDYLSLMHYSALTFSKDPDNKEYSMVPRDPSFPADKLGQRRGFSAVDLQQILTFYNCPNRNLFVPNPEDLSAQASDHFDPEEPARINQALRQARTMDNWPLHENDIQFISQPMPMFVPAALDSVLKPVPNSIARFPPVVNGACSNSFFPDAVLNFLGFFYLFKDGLYWKFTYSEGKFTSTQDAAKSYSLNFSADLPAQLDAVFSYLQYIYFVKGSSVWVAKSDAEIRGPITLKQLFPSLPEIIWNNVFVRGVNIHFIWGTFTWIYDVKTDSVLGPVKDVQNPAVLDGPVTELPDGLVAAFPRPRLLGQQAQIYILDHFADQVMPGFPKAVSAVFC